MTDPGNPVGWQGEAGWFGGTECPNAHQKPEGTLEKKKKKQKKEKQDVMQLFYAHSGPVIAAVAWICIPATLKGPAELDGALK